MAGKVNIQNSTVVVKTFKYGFMAGIWVTEQFLAPSKYKSFI